MNQEQLELEKVVGPTNKVLEHWQDYGIGTDYRTKPEVKGPVEAVKLDNGKTNWSLVPFDSVEEVAKVLEFGATKYAANNWKVGSGLGTIRVLNSALRHIFAFLRGEQIDPESGLSHLSHAACNLLFAIHYVSNKGKYKQDGVNEKNT